jgi:hypothetical protein
MQALPYDPSWIERRLLQDIHHVVHKDRYDRTTRRLTNLYRELMKFRITEDTFFDGKIRRIGEVMDFPVGPVKYTRSLSGKMEAVPQYEDLDPPVSTPLPTVTLQPAEPPPTETFMSITGIQSGAFEAKLADMRKKLTDRLNQGLTKIDGAAEAGAVKMEAAVDNVIAKVDAEIEDKLQEFATLTNGGPA